MLFASLIFLLGTFLEVNTGLSGGVEVDSESETHVIKFDINSLHNAAGRRIISINGFNSTYGPVLQVKPNDQLNLQIHNCICSPHELQLSYINPLWEDYCNTTLHFHGLIPIGNAVDGVPGLTQPAVGTDAIYWYNFTIPSNACGTFWYHSHSSVQYGDGLRGLVIVECSEYDSISNKIIDTLQKDINTKSNSLFELSDENNEAFALTDNVQYENIIFSDWYLKANIDILREDVLVNGGTNDPRLDGSLINGKEDHVLVFKLKNNTEYLSIRLLNSGMSSTQVFHVKNHQLIILETDGVLIKPYTVDTLTLAVGQRYSVIVKLKPTENKIIKAINGCNKMMGYITKELWFVYDSSNLDDINTEDSGISIKKLPGFTKNELYKELVPLNTSYFWNSPHMKHIELAYAYYSGETTKYLYGSGMYKVNGKTIQEYIQDPIQVANADSDELVEVFINSIDHMRHPWHLHGHNFQVVSIGSGGEGSLNFDSKSNNAAWDVYFSDLEYWRKNPNKSPSIRDSINIPGNSFAVIRFKPTQPGNWLLHCHVDWHVSKGLGTVLHITGQQNMPTSSVATTTIDLSAVKGLDAETASNPHKIRALTIYFIIMCTINYIFYRRLL